MAKKSKRHRIKKNVREVLDAKLLRAIQNAPNEYGISVFDYPQVKTLMHKRDRLLTDRSDRVKGPQAKRKKRSRLRKRS